MKIGALSIGPSLLWSEEKPEPLEAKKEDQVQMDDRGNHHYFDLNIASEYPLNEALSTGPSLEKV